MECGSIRCGKKMPYALSESSDVVAKMLNVPAEGVECDIGRCGMC